MAETTSKLFHALRGVESGKELLGRLQSSPECAQMLSELLKSSGVSAAEWIARRCQQVLRLPDTEG